MKKEAKKEEKKIKKTRKNKSGAGRPTKLNDELINKLETLLQTKEFLILTDEEICIYLGIDEDTKKNWLDNQKTDLHKKFFGLIKNARILQKMNLSRKLGNGENNWQGSAWILERKFEDLRMSQKNENINKNLNVEISQEDTEKYLKELQKTDPKLFETLIKTREKIDKKDL